MISLGQIFKRYTGFLRRVKPAYMVNNWLNRRLLGPNRELYRKYGLRKSILAPISSADFKQHNPDIPWIDRPDAMDRLAEQPGYAALTAIQKEKVSRFIQDGYCVLEGFFTPDRVDRLNQEIDSLIGSGKLDFNYTGRKIMESYKVSQAVNSFFRDKAMIDFLNFIMGKPVIPFHTINFIRGSEQRAHSDSVHMSTEPQGYLIATWTALEDIGPDQGPLFYYPGSHRFSYVTTQDFDSGNSRWLLGKNPNQKYEDRIEALIREKGIQPRYFTARKGDVLIWHANLLHGGSAIARPESTRKSLVAHYFCEGVICYHELTQRPALLPHK